MKKNIILIGMPGAGKSTVGVLLAKTVNKGFVDTDLLIQQRTGKTLQRILDEEGLDAFLKQEEAVLTSVDVRDCVIATGGSAVYSDRAMQHLKRNGTAVYLQVSYGELQKRLKNITTRGIVLKKGYTLEKLFEERTALYQTYADITVNCTGTDMETALIRTVESLRACGIC